MRVPARCAPFCACLVVALAALVAAAAVRAQDLQVIELRYRPAEEIIPIVQPLLEPDGILTGTEFQLLVRTSPANFEQIRRAVEAFDRAPRQLRITVGQGTVSDVEAAGVRGSATIGDEDVRVGVNRPPGGTTGGEVQVSARSEDTDLRNVSSVQTLEGHETYIAVGQSVPLQSTEIWRGPRGPVIRESTSYQDVATGFYATARINGDQVMLEISPRQQNFRAGDRVIKTGGLTSTVTGRLGQWIELGAVREQSSDSTAGILVWGRRTDSSEYSAWVKVEAIP
jgi:type II secretory pathway component GspD/PulD (secretin)